MPEARILRRDQGKNGLGEGPTWTLMTDTSGKDAKEVLVSATLADAQQSKMLLRSFAALLCNKWCFCCCTVSCKADRKAGRLRHETSALHSAESGSKMTKIPYRCESPSDECVKTVCREAITWGECYNVSPYEGPSLRVCHRHRMQEGSRPHHISCVRFDSTVEVITVQIRCSLLAANFGFIRS